MSDSDPIARKAFSICCPKCHVRPGVPCNGKTSLHGARYQRAARMIEEKRKLEEWERLYGGAK